MFGIYNLYDRVTRTIPDKLFVVEGNLRISYGQMGQMTNKLAFGFSQMGIGAGSNVGYVMLNSHRTIMTFFALQKLGVFMTPFNYRFAVKEMSQYITMVGCEYFIYDMEYSDAVEQIKNEHPDVVWVPTEMYKSLMDNEAENWGFFEDMPPDSPAVGILTGGSTGRSKVAVHSKYSMMMQQCQRQTWLFDKKYISVPMVYLLVSPLFHVGGIGPMFNIISIGGTLVFSGKFDPEHLAMLIDREKVTDLVLIPPNLAQRIKDTGIHKVYDFSSVRYVGIGGGNISPGHIKVVYEVFPNAECELMYSQSEYASFISLLVSPELLAEKPHLAKSIGKPVYFTQAKIMREDGTEAGVDEVGELYARCEGMMKGYLHQTQSPFKSGWLPTGDLLRKDSEGYYYFMDRKKDMIKSGGENVFTAEVEAVIKQIPGVSEVAVFGLPDDFYGEAVSAAIVLSPGAEVKKETILEFCKGHIASYKKPRHIFYVSELPRSGAGKVQKAALKEKFLDKI